MKRTLRQIIEVAKGYLQGDFTQEDIFLLIQNEYNLQDYQVLLNLDNEYEDEALMEKIQRCVIEPIGYILGYQMFYGREFNVNKNVLIPRYETEELVQLILNCVSKDKSYNILDIGTGSGCIAISLDLELSKLGINHNITASDISKDALEVAKGNNNKLSAKVNFVESDVLNDVPDTDYDIIVSNPPYIAKDEYVAKRVLDNEPHLALYAEEEGLLIYRKIIEQAKQRELNPEFFFEISPPLVERLKKLQQELYPNYVTEIIKDINGFDRICYMHE